ncbi:MAG: hypothetical protein H0X37_22715 [Herpetosiphonaceae bacterium]|nr:hypothetical protein [Herpetosiphonaceae bacterium]
MRQMRGRGIQALIALLLALGLWSYVSFSTNPTTELDTSAPVTVTNVPTGLALVDPLTAAPTLPTSQVTFHVSGPQDIVKAFPPPVFRAHLDLKGLPPGVHDVPVRLDADSPLDVQTSNLQPSSLKIRLEALATHNVHVVVKKQGQVPFVFDSGQIKQNVQTATVNGPASLVQQVVSAQALIPLQNQTSDINTQVDLEPVDRTGVVVIGVTLTPPTIGVQIPVTPKVQPQQAAVVPTIVGSLPPGYVYGLEWEPRLVTVLAANGITGTLETEPITITGLTSSITRTVQLAAKQNMITDPPNLAITVRLSINPIGVQQQLILALPIAPINIGEDLDVLASPLTISVTLAGPFQQLAQLTLKQLPATVDLRSRGPGTYHLPVDITVPAGLVRVAPTKPEVTVILTPRPTPIPTPAPTSPPTPTPPPAPTSTPRP